MLEVFFYSFTQICVSQVRSKSTTSAPLFLQRQLSKSSVAAKSVKSQTRSDGGAKRPPNGALFTGAAANQELTKQLRRYVKQEHEPAGRFSSFADNVRLSMPGTTEATSQQAAVRPAVWFQTLTTGLSTRRGKHSVFEKAREEIEELM